MTDIITRELLTGSSTTGNKDHYLVIDDLHGDGKDKYRRYLATSATFPVSEPPEEHPLRIATVRFNAVVDHSTRATASLTSGWLYLFVNGKLWREIRVLGRYQYQDVNLERYLEQPEDARPAECSPRDTIVVPVSLSGEAFTLEAALSSQQWSWARIEELGGFELSKADRQSAADNNDLRTQRCTVLDYLRQQSIDEDDLFAINPLTVHNYELLNIPRQDLIFSLPDWQAMGHTLHDAHDDVIGAITHLQQALASPRYYLASLPPGPEQQQQAEQAARALPLAILTANEVGYGQAKRNLQDSTRAYFDHSHFDKATQARLQAGRERLSLQNCIDTHRLEEVLHSQEFLALHKESNVLKDKMMELLQEPRFVAMMRDYATLGSDEQSATRIKGLVVFAEIFDGFNLDVFRLIEPYLGTSEHLGFQNNNNPILDIIPRLLNLEGKPIDLFFMVLDFERLYPQLYAEFVEGVKSYQEQAKKAEDMSFAARYNPENRGLTDELIELIGEDEAQKLVQSLMKLFAGLMVLDESELSRVARTDTPAKVDGHVAGDDDYDKVIQTQKQEIKDLEARKTELEGKQKAQRLAIDEQKENIKTLKEDLIKSRQQKADLETQYRISEPTRAQIDELQNLKANIRIDEYELKNLETTLRGSQRQHQQTQAQLNDIQHKLTITKRKTTGTPRGHRPDTMSASQVDSTIKSSQSKLGLGSQSQLKVGEMSHFVGGSRVVRVKVDVDDLIDGKLPPHLIPTNPKGIERMQARRRNAFNLITEGGGPVVQVDALGVRFPVPAQALQSNNHDVQWALNGLAAKMLDQKKQLPSSRVDLYCFRANIDITVSERQWAAVQQYSANRELYSDYLKASEAVKARQFVIIHEQHALDELKGKLQHIRQEQQQTIDSLQSYRESNLILIHQDRRIHWVQGPLQGIVLVFDVNNMISKWQAMQNSSSLTAWWEAGTSVIAVAGSVVDTFESLFRSFSHDRALNYHNLTDRVRSGFRITGKLLGFAGAIIGIVSGYFDLMTARAQHDNARYIGSGLAILSGALMIVALVVGSVPLSIGSLVLGLVSALFSAFYETAEQTHWLKSGFGYEHDQHQETPGLENWDDPTICAQGLRSLLCRPIIEMKKDPYWVTITVQSSVLAGYTTPEIELDIKADFNIGNEDEHPWQLLHSPFIANTDAKAVADARKQDPDNKGLMSTYGVSYDRLASNARIIQQGNQTQYRFDRGLFTEMLENLNKDNRWYKGDFNIDDFLFQVRVRG
ncbi:MAG: hypothetical protein P8X74_13800, partial [Reinekea sp.]